MSLQRVVALRGLMATQTKPLAAFIVPTSDAHNSEYISICDARRSWLTGFTGSAGTAVVTSDTALVWTDGRYYTQFEKEVDLSVWTLMKESLPETLTVEKWLAKNLLAGSIVGVDPTTMGHEDWSTMKKTLQSSNIQIVGVNQNLVDVVRVQMNELPPPRPSNEIIPLDIKYTGKSSGDKVKELREKMVEKNATVLIVTALDEIAYTLNLRGSDIPYNPVFYSYLIITPSTVTLFWQDGVLAPSILEKLTNEKLEIVCKAYNEIFTYLEKMTNELAVNGDVDHTIWLSNDASQAIHVAASGDNNAQKRVKILSEASPVSLMKFIKNDVELQGFRNCHIRDGTAVIRFFSWLETELGNNGNVTITETDAAQKLLEFRQEEENFMGLSFETIAGAGENGAVIHYSPSEKHPRVISKHDVLLLDSGGQYLDGTTDITRTRHMSGNPTAEQKSAFTRVLKGQILMGSALFPKGVKGNVLDSYARKFLWDYGEDYAHGTGHGVGHYLNVHEGPSGISWRSYAHDPGLDSGAVFSNEPGFYKVGEFGIRHEDLVEIVSVDKDSDHPKAKNLLGNFNGRGVLGFKTLTMVPNQTSFIEVSLLDDFELSYINNYHECVLKTIGPILEKRGFVQELKWLKNECRVISRE